MATAPQAPRRSMAPPPAPPPQAAPAQEADTGQSLYEYALDCIRSIVNPNFAPQGTKEEPHRFFHRIGMALYEMAPEQFDQLDPELKAWYDSMAQAVETDQPIEPLQGFYAEEPAAPGPTAPQTDAGKKEQPAGLAKWRADQKALKEAQAAGGASAASNGHNPPAAPPRRAAPGAPPAQAAAPATPPRRMAPPAAPPPAAQTTMPQRHAPTPPAQQAPQRRVPPAAPPPAPAAPAPARRQQAVGRQQEVVDDLRRMVLANPNTTPDELRAYSASQGYVQADTTIGAICSAVKAIHGLMARDGWTLEPPAWYYEGQS